MPASSDTGQPDPSASTHSRGADAPTPPRPVRPRDAASLVIHRKRRTHYEVLMGRRGSRARFKPGVWVFPGGGLERADYHARPLRPLDDVVAGQLAVGRTRRKADALAMAAVREAYEEAGLAYGHPGDVGNVGHATWREFRRRALAPDLGALDFLGRAITPTHRPLRYHARFFGIEYERLEGEIGGDGELEDLRFVRIDATGGLEMMIVQETILATLARRLRGEQAPPQRLFYARGRRHAQDV
ncbi:MAG: NUDIX domain-containing protein [Gammaproteobacteria bacterium]